MSRGKELVKNTAIVGAGKLCTQFISFLLLPLYTSILSTAEYGTVDILNTYVSLLMPIFTLQLEQGVFRFLVDARTDEKRIRILNSTVLLFMAVVSLSYCGGILLIEHFFHIPYSGYLLVNLVAIGFSNVLLQIARGLGNNIAYSVGSFFTAFTTILLNIGFVVFLKWGVSGMLLATGLGNVACCLYLILSQRLYKFFSLKFFCRKTLKSLLRYSVPLIPNTLSWWIVSASDRTVVTWFLGVAANGVLSIAHKFSVIYNAIYEVVSLTWTESIVLYLNDEDGISYMNKAFNTALNLFSTVNIGIIACIPFLFPLLVNPSYGEAYYQIPILLAAALFNTVAGLLGAVYVNKKMTREIASSTLIAAGLNVVLHMLLIHWMGLYAASVSSLLAYVVMAGIRYIRVRQLMPIQISAPDILATAIVASITIVGYYIKNLWVNASVLLLVIVYAVLLNRVFLQTVLKEAKNMLKFRKK